MEPLLAKAVGGVEGTRRKILDKQMQPEEERQRPVVYRVVEWMDSQWSSRISQEIPQCFSIAPAYVVGCAFPSGSYGLPNGVMTDGSVGQNWQ